MTNAIHRAVFLVRAEVAVATQAIYSLRARLQHPARNDTRLDQVYLRLWQEVHDTHNTR